MKRSYLLFTALVLLFIAGSCKSSHSEAADKYVILVSCDAFRWDYPDIYATPNLDRMAEEGVKAESLVPSFPSLTFPNHYTIATGLYPDHHGLIHNKFYAPDLDMMYRVGDRSMVENPAFYSGEPIWVTAEEQGVISASYFWVGTEAPIDGVQPTYWKRYVESMDFTGRVDTVIKWLNLPEGQRPHFITLYYQEPDATSHDFGPLSTETGNMVTHLDSIVGYLRQQVAGLAIGEKVNIIVTADHGMGPISPEKYKNIATVLDSSRVVRIVGSNPVYLLATKGEYADTAVELLSALEGVEAYKKEELPAHLHYGTNSRIPEVVAFADSSWSIGITDDAGKYTGGAHGFDPSDSDMHAIFYAVGPDFKSGYMQPKFYNVDIYGLLCALLGLEPAQNDGELSRVEGMLKKEPQ